MAFQIVSTLLVSIFLASPAFSAKKISVVRKCDRKAMVGVTQLPAAVVAVSDGDTISVVFPDGATGKARLLGIDAPEAHYMGQSQGPAGDESLGALQRMLTPGTPVVLEFDKDNCDMYGRYLAFVGRRDQAGLFDVNGAMVAQGFAVPYCFRPKMTRCALYTKLGVDADRAGLNIFKRYKIEMPDAFRRRVSEAQKAPLPLEPMIEHQ
jgi:endonuclease YncB( thermonuclease family)